MNEPIRPREMTAWKIECKECGEIYLTAEERRDSLSRGYWTCPICFSHATFDNAHYAEFTNPQAFLDDYPIRDYRGRLLDE